MGKGTDVTGPGSRAFLIIAAIVMLIAAAVFLVNPPEIGIAPTSADASQLAARIVRHPSDWPAASALTEVALDTRLDTRVQLWRAAYEHASLLAPERADPPNAFARAAFFHWTELSEKDRNDALNAYATLLRDPTTFHRMARPIFELTGDLTYLQRAGPPTADTTAWLIGLALPNGRFADYRALRHEWQKQHLDEFTAKLHSATPEELIAALPSPPYHADTEPLIKALLDELHQRPLSENPGRPELLDAIVDYALRHNLGPLDGLEVISRTPGAASAETRMRLARALDLKERARQIELASSDPRRVLPNEHDWQGLCQTDICTRGWRIVDADHGIALTIESVKSDEVPPYVEIYVDDMLRAEGDVIPQRDFVVPAGERGPHRLEVVLANPMTRNQSERRVRIKSLTTL
jgi:hypothetical protein